MKRAETEMPMQHHIFLSYSRKDTLLMQRIREDLQANELTVWTDSGIEPGTPLWKDSIEQAIENAGCLVVILSPDSKQSQWVKRELEYAEAQAKPIYPLMARGDERSAVPFGLIGTQFIDIQSHYPSGMQNLIITVTEHLGTVRTVQPSGARHLPATQHFLPSASVKRLNPWNFLDQFQLLWWLLFEPQHLQNYLQYDEGETAKKTGSWVVSALGWLLILIPLLGYSMGTVPVFGRRSLALMFAYVLIMIGWIAAGWLGGGDNRAGVVILTLTGIITFMVFFLTRGVSEIEFITPDIRGNIGLIGLGIGIGIAAGISFCIAYTATATLAGLVIGSVLFSVMIRVFPGQISAIAGLLMVGVAFISASILNNGIQTGKRSLGHYAVIAIFAINYAVLVWLYLLGGWQVLTPAV